MPDAKTKDALVCRKEGTSKLILRAGMRQPKGDGVMKELSLLVVENPNLILGFYLPTHI